MIKSNQRFLNAINALSDAVLVLCSYLFSAWFWLDVLKGNQNMASISSLSQGTGLAACIYAVTMVVLFAVFKLYNPSRIRRIHMKIVVICEANVLGIVSIGALLYLFRLEDFSRGVIFTFFVTSSVVISAKHVGLHYFLKKMRERGYNQKHILVVGAGVLARQYILDVSGMPNLGLSVSGYFSDAPNDALDAHYLGRFDTLEVHLQGTGVDEVVVALEPEDSHQVKQIISVCEKCGTKVSVIPFYNEIIPANPSIEIVGKTKLINLRNNPLDNMGYAALKRLFDILASVFLLLVFSPIFIIVPLGIKLSSPGPVFFLQQRVGRKKKLFTMFKFRSMRVNSQPETGWTTDRDPRQTKFGSFIRKCSIDELPQLLNVLKGDMSLVGPRPEIPFYVERFKEDVPLYMVKHQVRPGMTGWAQVNGYRGDTSIPKRIEHDIWYIEHWSAGLDMRILFMTIWGGWLNRRKKSKDKPADVQG